MKFPIPVKVLRLLAEILIPLFVVLIIATSVGFSYSTLINQTFKLQSYKVIEGDSGQVIEVEEYTADFENYDQLRASSDALCEEVEAEGLVLLKNEPGTLPLSAEERNVSLFLTGSVEFNSSRQGMRIWTPSDPISDRKYPTLRAALEAEGFSVNDSLWDLYDTGAARSYGGTSGLNPESNKISYNINEAPWSLLVDNGMPDTFASYGDAAIVVITRDDTEGSDPNVNFGSDGEGGNYLALSPEERDVLEQVSALRRSGTFGKVIVLLNSAIPVQLDFLDDEDVVVDACLWVGNVGASGIHAVVDALIGKVNPSGRLTDTYLKDNLSSPAMASWALNPYGTFSREYNGASEYSLTTTQRNYGVYNEGIYVGYRYYETRYEDVVLGTAGAGDYVYSDEVAYPFGYGLSYTTFSYSDFTVAPAPDGKTFNVSVYVENTGETDGRHTVQIYAQKPYTSGGVEKASVELVGFAKTNVLGRGGGETVNITVEKSRLTSFDTDGAGTYILDKGDYLFTVGRDAHDAINNILAFKDLTAEQDVRMDGEGNAELVATALSLDAADTETYSVSEETGNEINARLDWLDINKYEGREDNSVTYVSRRDWTGTWPTESIEITVTDRMAEDLANKTIEDIPENDEAMPGLGEQNGLSLAMLHPTINGTGEIIPYDDPRWDDLTSQMTFDEMNMLLTTGFCQTASVSSVSKPQTKEMDGPTYCKESTSGARFPCEGIWASTFDLDLLREIGIAMANDTLLTDYSGMWIPGINIHRTPYGGRAHEYFSEDPFLTGIAAEAEIKGIQSKGVMAYPKHYVFNDQESDRNGVSVWLNEQAAREIFLEPWKYACSPKRGNAHAIMSSFNRAGALWTSGSADLIDGILRDEFGFEGFVMTDMADSNGVEYMTTLNGILAGTDIWLTSSGHSFNDYRNEPVVVNAMFESCKRILFNVGNYSVEMNGTDADDRFVNILTWWQILLIVIDVVVGVAAVASAGLFCYRWLVERKRAVKQE